ncbi:MAG: hypothetical protein CVU55_12850 [Deltaproteobacteria bacterium HGW-Deltaproteobacteria-13]|jgi:hypothetical protein|nr:MAG: hypothetical protein CVU55_12850 [Deltaproteobacteria bacterium HGW-Deltaproteobacteria-13]
MAIFLAGKSRRLLQNTHLLRYAANRTAQRMIYIRLAVQFLRALHLSIFEQPRTEIKKEDLQQFHEMLY